MGFRFRKSVNLGPLRVNFSKSGIGWSVGTKGARFTKKANGGYRTTVGVPGTGVSYVKDYPSSSTEPKQSRNPQYRYAPRNSGKGLASMTDQELMQGKEELLQYLASGTAPSSCNISMDEARFMLAEANKELMKRQMKKEKAPKRKKAIIIAVSAFAAVYVFVILNFTLQSVNLGSLFQSRDYTCTETVSQEALWYPNSRIEILRYPDLAFPGDHVVFEIDGAPDTRYLISVYTDTGPLESSDFIPQVSTISGRASWDWVIPANATPGIYFIHVTDGVNEQAIDYAILDSEGNVVGTPPVRDLSVHQPANEEDFYIDVGSIEDNYPASSQMVYVTATGSKYHTSSCRYAENATCVSLDEALSRGLTPCEICH